jgi:multiple sugar transport system permease protein
MAYVGDGPGGGRTNGWGHRLVRRPRLRLRHRERILAYALLTPALLVVLGLMAYPLYLALDLSLREGTLIDLSVLRDQALTLGHYRQVITDSETWRSVWLSAIYTVGSTAPAFAIGLATAMLLNAKFPGRRLIRPALLLPWPIPGVAISVIFLWMLDSSYGVINSILRRTGIIAENVGWFVGSDTAMVAVVIPTIWKYYPFFTLMLLAALQNVPQILYEAVRVDGAGRFREFTAITWPGIRGPAILAVIIGGLGIFREFDVIFPLTGGGPLRATETLAIKVYNEAFRYHNLPEASALGILAIGLAGVAVIYLGRHMRKEFF